MTDFNPLKAVLLELTISEAMLINDAISSYNPKKQDEIIAFMLYSRIENKIKEALNKK